MSANIRVAVIGAGNYAGLYHIPHLAKHPNVDLVALCSKDAADLTDKARRFGGVATFTDHLELLERTPLDAIVVSSPHALHYAHCRAGLERGLHVLVDKHPVLRTTEWLELIALAERNGKILMPALNRHLDPANLYARHLIRSGALGEIFFARSLQVGYPLERHYVSLALAGGGPLVGRGSHMAALLPWLTGWQPQYVTALVTHRSGLEVDVGGIINVRTTTGAMFQIAATQTGARGYDEVEIVGTAGSIRVERLLGRAPWVVAHGGTDGESIPIGTLPTGKTTTDHFVDVIRGAETVRISPSDGRVEVEIIDAAYESIRQQRTITLC